MSLPKSDGKERSGPGESPGQTGDTGINNVKIMIFSVLKAKFFSKFTITRSWARPWTGHE